ncbi:hypothetical protein AGMMS4956_07870 [Bacteroidia bacterium]|nr:hypothetical protein AGMMS4956_07870 [Bacteroidia bacterium]
MREENAIVSFTIPSLDLTGVIDDAHSTVTLTVSPDKMSTLQDVVPSINISPSASISPAAGDVQDFTSDVQYVVTSESLAARTWTVKTVADDYVSAGIGQITEKWDKTATDLGLSANVEATIATNGTTVVAGRSGVMIDGTTGEKLPDLLNMTGVVCNGTPAQDIIFTVANDDAGTLIGCTLGAWGAAGSNDFKVYKWTSPTDAPTEFISHPQSSTSHFGRKLTAVGNVNSGKAIVTSYDVLSGGTYASSVVTGGAATHAYWEINNGTANAGSTVLTNYNCAGLFQMLWPVSPNAVAPYYFSDMGSASAAPITTVQYNNGSTMVEMPKGPVEDTEIVDPADVMFKQTGYGRKILHSMLFTFNSRQYLAIVSYYNNGTTDFTYYITILDTQDAHRVVFFDKRPYTGNFSINGNQTAGLAVSTTTDADRTKTMRLYALFSSSGMVAYEIDNLAP